ncbi:MAG TPA: SMP-30/gluconolactonase/LRE family protein [Anaerolineales bacterium]|nr:SMP-30/gluconolactonase/LRE family protein [Anaerolineales bacterium]
MKVELILDAKATLGEGPAWDSKTQTLYWLDILEKRIYADTRILAQLDDLVCCIAPRKNGNLLLGTRLGFADLNPDSVQLTVLAALDSELPTNRLNDGKCDPAGRLLAGTMDMNEKDPNGSLYSFDGKNSTRLLDKVTISNGLAWSVDHKTFYYIDTPTREVKAFDYDLATGQIANPRAAIHVPESLGWPDGMTSDTDGNLWIALWGGAQITKWNPSTGKLLEQIPVPALQTSSCVFGGKDMNELYITSARKSMSETDLKKYPLSGGLFKVITNVVGMKTFEFNEQVTL